MSLCVSILLMACGDLTITLSSTQQNSVPVPYNPDSTLNGPSGFGDGFRFHYNQADGQTHQSSWSQRQYRFYSDTKNEPGNAAETQASVFTADAANDAGHDERSLGIYDRLCFACEVSVRYHTRRHTHYEKLSRMIAGSIILLSAFAFIGGVDHRAVLGLSIVGLAAGSVVWNVHSQSRNHDVLRSEYQSLLEQIRMSPEPTPEDIRRWRTLRLRTQSKEPAVYWAVANDCYYEVARVWDLEPRRRGHLPAMLRPFMNWFRF